MEEKERAIVKSQSFHMEKMLELSFQHLVTVYETHPTAHINVTRNRTAHMGKIKHTIELEYTVIAEEQ